MTQENTRRKCGHLFAAFAERSAAAAGSPIAFVLALAMLGVWAVLGPALDFSDVWQLVINTITTIITFLLVILLQNSQNRETRALQLKLDELIRATDGAHNSMLNLEKLSDETLTEICAQYEKLAEEARRYIVQEKNPPPGPTLIRQG